MFWSLWESVSLQLDAETHQYAKEHSLKQSEYGLP